MQQFARAYNAMKYCGITHMSGYNADMAIDPEYIEWENKYKTIIEKKPTRHQQFIYDYIKAMTTPELEEEFIYIVKVSATIIPATKTTLARVSTTIQEFDKYEDAVVYFNGAPQFLIGPHRVELLVKNEHHDIHYKVGLWFKDETLTRIDPPETYTFKPPQ